MLWHSIVYVVFLACSLIFQINELYTFNKKNGFLRGEKRVESSYNDIRGMVLSHTSILIPWKQMIKLYSQ